MASARWKHAGQFITLQESLQKCAERHSCFSRVETVEHISLPPQYLGRLTEGVKEELNSGLMKYSDTLQAIPVAYEGIKILQRKGEIMEDSPFIHFDVQVKFIVFKPTVDSKLVGVVNKIGTDHIGCLVHRSFNASISKSNVKNHDVYDNLEIGSNCEFSVIGIETVNGVVSINGRIDEGRPKERYVLCTYIIKRDILFSCFYTFLIQLSN